MTGNGNGVKVVHNGSLDATDVILQVEAKTHETYEEWNRQKIVDSILSETDLSEKTAKQIAEAVEGKIEASSLEVVSTDTIRELIDGELLSRGYTRALRQYAPFSIPFAALESLMFGGNKENSNQTPNPESVNLSVAEMIFKEYALREVFTGEVAEAHRKGDIHLHDLGFISRPYCGGHSLEYIKKYGLQLPNITSTSKPAKHAGVLVGHMVKMASTLQSFYAGAVGWDAVNIFFAPFLRGKSFKEVRQVAQMLIFEFNQLAGARGAQVVFSDFNLYGVVPKHFRDTPAMGPGGLYCYEVYWHTVDQPSGRTEHWKRTVLGVKKGAPDKSNSFYEYGDRSREANQKIFPREVEGWDSIKELTYADYEEEAQTFLEALFSVYMEGDAMGQTFFFPKPLLHLFDDCFKNKRFADIFKLACEVASKQGITYFVFDRGDDVTVSQCCRLRLKLDTKDLEETKSPERMRFSALQNITLNLPRAAFRVFEQSSSKDWKKKLPQLDAELERLVDLAVAGHKAKKRHIRKLLSLGKEGMLSLFVLEHDGKPYLQMDRLTYLVGIIGLNEMVQHILGEELHESDAAYKLGMRIVSKLSTYCNKLGQENNIHLVLEESPAESACYRLASLDLREYPEQVKRVIRGNMEKDQYYYTNSVHFNYSASIDYISRIEGQSKFHPLIDAGAIIHVWLGEQEPDPASIGNLVEKVMRNTDCTQLAFSPEFTVCEACQRTFRGFLDKCPNCGSEEIYQVTRIVGYFSKVQNWNPAKLGELEERQRGLEMVMMAGGAF